MPADRPVMVVTGGARGIGAAIVRAAVAEYDVVVDYATSEAAARHLAQELAHVGRVDVVRADVAVEADVLALFDHVDRELGRIDVLVNNAAVSGGYGTLQSVDSSAMARMLAVNVIGAFLCAREAARRMSTQEGGAGGAIVNVSSKAAVIGGAGEWVHYAASKGAIDTMTVGLARELAPCGIRVNAVRPGLIESDFHEVAAAVLWLASPAASYVTGAIVDVSGGR